MEPYLNVLSCMPWTFNCYSIIQIIHTVNSWFFLMYIALLSIWRSCILHLSCICQIICSEGKTENKRKKRCQNLSGLMVHWSNTLEVQIIVQGQWSTIIFTVKGCEAWQTSVCRYNSALIAALSTCKQGRKDCLVWGTSHYTGVNKWRNLALLSGSRHLQYRLPQALPLQKVISQRITHWILKTTYSSRKGSYLQAHWH